jgi:hypothetical protein
VVGASPTYERPIISELLFIFRKAAGPTERLERTAEGIANGPGWREKVVRAVGLAVMSIAGLERGALAPDEVCLADSA